MNIARKPKIVLLGFLGHFPVAGVAWQTVHYLVGLQKLGCEVFYVEAHGCTPTKLMQHPKDDGEARAASYIAGIMARFSLQNNWAYHAIYDSRYFGMTELQLKQLYRDAAVIINLHGSHVPTPELTATNRLVFLETDPVDVQIELHNGKQETIDYLTPHCAFFTFGENLGTAGCLVPNSTRFNFIPTRQPVVMEFWEHHGSGDATTFTTIGNWRQSWREVQFNGETLRWSKHLEFQKFISLPKKLPAQPFELALASFNQADRHLLESHGWRVHPGAEVSQSLDVYRDYISGSRGEFTVAKEQNIRLRSGWFSDRAATYLAAGRPVVTQETGFSNVLPVGEGLFAFSTMEEIVAAVEAINADYPRHRRAALTIARDFFSHEVVLSRLLQHLGVSNKSSSTPQPSPTLLPESLVIAPISRLPTRLPDETNQTALALPIPMARPTRRTDSKWRASVIVVTYNGLLYTKMCLAVLIANWPDGDELIIVDNASTDGTPDFLREVMALNPFVRVLFNENNRGFAAANNQGLALATRDIVILLNNDTLVPPGWQDGLMRWLQDPAIGMVGPVTNRTCNEAQIDAPYKTYGEMEQFAGDYVRQHSGQANDIRMLAMFCVAARREIFQQIGPIDEAFGLGMFEDEDYSWRLRQAGYRVVCAEDVFVHHYGQASFGELCATGELDQLLESNRRRLESKWNFTWQPHARRITPEYQQLRRDIEGIVATRLPSDATVLILSKGDDELVKLRDRQCGWHFPQLADGRYSYIYPAHSAEAIEQLEALRGKGASHLLFPKPALWWLDYYREFKDHLESRYRLAVREEDCIIFDLGGTNGS